VRPLRGDERGPQDRRRAPAAVLADREVSAPILGMPMLEVASVSAFYGKHRALDGVSLQVTRGEIVVILGANGAANDLLKVIGGL